MYLIPTVIALAACSLLSDEPQAASDESLQQPVSDAEWTKLVRKKEIISGKYNIDDKYPSMRGPSGFDHAVLLETKQPELLWITGYTAEVVDAKKHERLSQELLSHAVTRLVNVRGSHLSVEDGDARFDAHVRWCRGAGSGKRPTGRRRPGARRRGSGPRRPPARSG